MSCEFGSQDQGTIKYNNTKMVLDIIRGSAGISRSAIARMTGMSPTSATRIVACLQELGLVRETSSVSNGVGRKAVMLDINGGLFHCVGIDMSQKDLVIGIVNFRGGLINTLVEHIRRDPLDGRAMAQQLYDMYKKLLNVTGIDKQTVMAVGIGTIGTVDIETGTVLYADLMQWSNVPIGGYVEDVFGLPTFVDNEVKCALIGEIHAGNAAATEDTVYLTFGRGVGGAIYNDGRLIRGISNFAGEIGHTIVDYTDGRLCPCGRRGCVAAYLSEDRIVAHAREAFPEITSVAEIINAFQQKKSWAIPQVERICNYISIAISNTICYLNPANIIMGGSLLDNYPFLFDLAIDKYNNTRYEPLRASTRFKRSILKSNSTCVGSGVMAIEKHLSKKIMSLLS
jgi:predicted NBD/HSP70 family sugar kinase